MSYGWRLVSESQPHAIALSAVELLVAIRSAHLAR